MSLIKITTDLENPEDLFKAPEFPTITPGKHAFMVANQLEVTQSSGDNPKDMIRLEARCIDEDENKNRMIFDNFLLIPSAVTDKEQTSKRIHDAKLAQFIAAVGIATPEQIASGAEFNIADAFGKAFEAETKNAMEPVYPEEIGEDGKPKKTLKSSIKRYLVPVTSA